MQIGVGVIQGLKVFDLLLYFLKCLFQCPSEKRWATLKEYSVPVFNTDWPPLVSSESSVSSGSDSSFTSTSASCMMSRSRTTSCQCKEIIMIHTMDWSCKKRRERQVQRTEVWLAFRFLPFHWKASGWTWRVHLLHLLSGLHRVWIKPLQSQDV